MAEKWYPRPFDPVGYRKALEALARKVGRPLPASPDDVPDLPAMRTGPETVDES